MGRQGGGKERKDEGTEDKEKTCKHGRETAKRSAHVPCVGRVSFSLTSLSPWPEIPPRYLPRRQCSIPLLGHKASVKCSVLIIDRTKGTQQSRSDSYLLKSSSQSSGRGGTDEERKGRGGVSLVCFSFWLVAVDLKKENKDSVELYRSLRAPGVLFLASGR